AHPSRLRHDRACRSLGTGAGTSAATARRLDRRSPGGLPWRRGSRTDPESACDSAIGRRAGSRRRVRHRLTLGGGGLRKRGGSRVAVSLRPHARAWFGGFKPRLFATGLSVLAFTYFFLPPIIEAHGGKLWAESNRGPGAAFSFRLPAAGRPATA